MDIFNVNTFLNVLFVWLQYNSSDSMVLTKTWHDQNISISDSILIMAEISLKFNNWYWSQQVQLEGVLKSTDTEEVLAKLLVQVNNRQIYTPGM